MAQKWVEMVDKHFDELMANEDKLDYQQFVATLKKTDDDIIASDHPMFSSSSDSSPNNVSSNNKESKYGISDADMARVLEEKKRKREAKIASSKQDE